ncbi:MAG: HYR domain-containing protein, partial [Gaiellales bacterium]
MLATAVLAAGLFVSPAASDPIALAPPAILSGPADPTNLTSASFEFTGEGESFECSLDGTPFAACTSPQSYSALGEGSRSFEVRAVSLDGQSEPTSYAWYIDLMPPQLPENVSAEASSAGGAVVVFAATDDHELASAACEPASGSTFALGTTTVACAAADAAGNSVAGEFDVTVGDATSPALDLPADITAEATGPEGAAVGYAASASDLVDGPLEADCEPASGSTFALGTTTVAC